MRGQDTVDGLLETFDEYLRCVLEGLFDALETRLLGCVVPIG